MIMQVLIKFTTSALHLCISSMDFIVIYTESDRSIWIKLKVTVTVYNYIYIYTCKKSAALMSRKWTQLSLPLNNESI